MSAAQTAAKRAATLTHRLLAFSRRQTLEPKPIDVNQLIAGMDELIRRTVGPEISVEVVGAGGLWVTIVDPHQLESALLNLCINARDAMPNGGRLTIETANRWLDKRSAQERDLPEGQYISMCVSDTGTGMPPDVIARAFEPFFTTKPMGQGTGLGLSMVYGFARQSGGQVRIYSEVGQGTTVCIYLPRHYGESVDTEAGASIAPPRASVGHSVLVVDDEAAIRMMVSDVLNELGYNAVEAADGPTAMKILRSRIAHRFAGDRCWPAERDERSADRGRRPVDQAEAQGDLHHWLCRERRHWSRLSRTWHDGPDQAIHPGSACRAHSGNSVGVTAVSQRSRLSLTLQRDLRLNCFSAILCAGGGDRTAPVIAASPTAAEPEDRINRRSA